jgi:predicted DNA-binding protein YlxM (UPF0122 family)
MNGMIQVPKFPELKFDEHTHVYTLEKVQIPSVKGGHQNHPRQQGTDKHSGSRVRRNHQNEHQEVITMTNGISDGALKLTVSYESSLGPIVITAEDVRKEIVKCVIDTYREEEARIIRVRNDKKRANVKLLLRKYRQIVSHVEKAVYEASQVEDDFSLQDIIEMTMGNGIGTFRVEALFDSVAKARIMTDHISRMIEIYRALCESSKKPEEKRRFKVIYSMYIAPERKTLDEIAHDENIDKSTVYRDIDAAADELSVLLFGIYGIRFL